LPIDLFYRMMVKYMDKKKQIEIELSHILNGYGNWFNDSSKNEDAKIALCNFYDKLITHKPEKDYKTAYGIHSSYIFNLLAIRKALNENKCMRACNEIITLLHNEPFLQKRIYYNLQELLKEYLKG